MKRINIKDIKFLNKINSLMNVFEFKINFKLNKLINLHVYIIIIISKYNSIELPCIIQVNK